MALSKEDIRKIKDAKGVDKLAEFAKANDIELIDDELEEVAGGCGEPEQRKTKVYCSYSGKSTDHRNCGYFGWIDGAYSVEQLSGVKCPQCGNEGYLQYKGQNY